MPKEKKIKIGIYKLTAPNGKIYVGQSTNLAHRKSLHSWNDREKDQKKLLEAKKEMGASNFIFEILEECDVVELNEKERYYQDLYDVCGENGLNSCLTWCKDKMYGKSYLPNKITEEEKKEILIKKLKVNNKASDSLRKLIEESKFNNEYIANRLATTRMTLFRFSHKSAPMDIAFIFLVCDLFEVDFSEFIISINNYHLDAL